MGIALLTVLGLLTACGASMSVNELQPMGLGEIQSQRLTGVEEPFARLGTSVATNGTWAAVGAIGSQVGGGGTGILRVYDLAADRVGDPVFETSAPIPGARFGNSLAVAGDTIFVGAPYDDEGGDRAGAVYGYERQGGDWQEVVRLTASAPAPLAYFGESLAFDGETLAVGAPGVGAGKVHLFSREGESWTEVAALSPSEELGERRFGSALALQSGRLAVGAWTSGAQESGRVYLYRTGSDGWEREWTIESSSLDDRFGWALSLHGETLAVAAPAVAGVPAVHLFGLADGDWTALTQLEAPAGASGFGLDIAFSGDLLVVSAPLSSVAAESGGILYTYRRSGDDWELDGELASPGAQSEEEFGAALALAGDQLIVGAPGGGLEPLSGAAYRLNLSPAVQGEEADSR